MDVFYSRIICGYQSYFVLYCFSQVIFNGIDMNHNIRIWQYLIFDFIFNTGSYPMGFIMSKNPWHLNMQINKSFRAHLPYADTMGIFYTFKSCYRFKYLSLDTFWGLI